MSSTRSTTSSATILAFFYGLIPNLGVAIILLTVVGDAGAVPAHREAGQGDAEHAAGAAGDQEAPGEVQERPRRSSTKR